MGCFAPKDRAGFTLVEVVIVVLILGILAGVAVPAVIGNTDDAKYVATMRSLQGLQRAAESYFAEKGKYPPDATHGVCPPLLRPYLQCNIFRHDPPIGGLYDWNYNYASFPFKACSSLYFGTGFSYSDCLAIDRMFDDGVAS